MTTSDGQGLLVTTVDGRQLNVLVSGPTDAMTLVAHMGTPNGLVPLPSQLDPGSRGLRTVLYARPGYVRSTPQPGRSVADAASDTAVILDALQVDTFVTVGLSGGGPHALACAALLPQRCLATAVIAGPSPYPSEAHGDDAFPITRQGEAAGAAFEEARAQEITTQPEDLAAMFPSEPDRARLTGEYADWLASYIRSGWAAGIAGTWDDNKACMLDWGFDLADVRRVSIWQGDQDEMVPPAHGVWLAEHIPQAQLRLLPGEGHISILLHFPEILDDLLARANQTSPSVDGGVA